MHDILPDDQKYYDKVYETAKKIAYFYNFNHIETPVLENSDLFVKGTGATTDIVQKQMYSLKTKGGDSLTLRPEGTPSIVRSYLENGMANWPQPVKLWYFGPFFRHEKPQAGRYRQFWQLGFEIIGQGAAIIDAQIIQIYYNLLKSSSWTISPLRSTVSATLFAVRFTARRWPAIFAAASRRFVPIVSTG